MLQCLVSSLELDLERLCEVLPEVMRRAGLQGTAVGHQRLDRVRARSAGKLLALALLPVDDRYRQFGLGEFLVERQDLQRLFLRLGFRFVRGVPFLPQELRGAQKRPRDLLPADDVRPLVDQDGKVAPRLNPLRVERADDDLGCRTHDQRLGELLVASAGDPRHLRREPGDVFFLLHQETCRNEERKVCVDVAGRLEATVQPLLDQLPDRVAVGPDRHAALDLGVVGELRPPHHIEIPAGKILGLRRDLGHGRFFLHSRLAFRHFSYQLPVVSQSVISCQS